jgi:hypothetical protein
MKRFVNLFNQIEMAQIVLGGFAEGDKLGLVVGQRHYKECLKKI